MIIIMIVIVIIKYMSTYIKKAAYLVIYIAIPTDSNISNKVTKQTIKA